MIKTFEHQMVYLNISANGPCECHNDKVDSLVNTYRGKGNYQRGAITKYNLITSSMSNIHRNLQVFTWSCQRKNTYDNAIMVGH
jgi:hypothetical protein